MGRGRRSGERLFYWSGLRDGGRGPSTPPQIRIRESAAPLRMTALCVVILVAFVVGAHSAWAAGPTLTTISDTVYRADGTAAAGTVLISWPAFQTVGGEVVAAGNQSVTIGTGGSFTTQLVPNVGATPPYSS